MHIEFHAVETRPFNAKNNKVVAKTGKKHKKLLDMVAYLHKGLNIMG
jgi:hypothetical protein